MSDAAKENWIEHYIFMGGQQWGDPPPTREEAERAWEERRPVIEMIPPGPYVEPRLAPKPATPEPPEWKGPLVSDDMWRRFAERIEADVANLEKARQEVCGITDLMRGVSRLALQASDANRALLRVLLHEAAFRAARRGW